MHSAYWVCLVFPFASLSSPFSSSISFIEICCIIFLLFLLSWSCFSMCCLSFYLLYFFFYFKNHNFLSKFPFKIAQLFFPLLGFFSRIWLYFLTLFIYLFISSLKSLIHFTIRIFFFIYCFNHLSIFVAHNRTIIFGRPCVAFLFLMSCAFVLQFVYLLIQDFFQFYLVIFLVTFFFHAGSVFTITQGKK